MGKMGLYHSTVAMLVVISTAFIHTNAASIGAPCQASTAQKIAFAKELFEQIAASQDAAGRAYRLAGTFCDATSFQFPVGYTRGKAIETAQNFLDQVGRFQSNLNKYLGMVKKAGPDRVVIKADDLLGEMQRCTPNFSKLIAGPTSGARAKAKANGAVAQKWAAHYLDASIRAAKRIDSRANLFVSSWPKEPKPNKAKLIVEILRVIAKAIGMGGQVGHVYVSLTKPLLLSRVLESSSLVGNTVGVGAAIGKTIIDVKEIKSKSWSNYKGVVAARLNAAHSSVLKLQSKVQLAILNP